MADIYKVAVGITLSSNYAEVLGAMAGQLRGIDGQVQGLIGKWDSLGASMRSTLTGLAQIAGSAAIFDFLGKATEAGGELVKFQSQLQNLGKSTADIQADTSAAMAAQIAVHGTNAAENLKVLRELSGVTANSEDARAILQDTLKAGAVVSSLMGGGVTDSIQTLVKAAELRGDGIDPKTGKVSAERLIAGVQAEVATLVAGGGLIKPVDLLSMVQQAGPMARMDTDPLAFWRSMATAMMDMGGRRAGTAETALGRQLLGEKMAMPTALEMEKLGLFKEGSVHKAGTGVKIDDGALMGEQILKGPGGLQAWMEGTLIPQMNAHGFTDTTSQMQELYKVFGTETARRMAALFISSQGQIAKDAGLVNAAAGQNLFGNMMGGDLGANLGGLSNALHGLMEVLGAPMVKPAIAALTGMTSAVNTLFGAFAAHPDAAKNTAELTGVAGATLFGLGARNLYQGLFGGGGLTGSAAALNTSAAMLQQAAVALGAKGVAGVGGAAGAATGAGGKMSGVLGFMSMIPGLLFAADKFYEADQAYRSAHPNGDGPSVFGRGAGALGGASRTRNPFAVGQPGVPDTGYKTNAQQSQASGIEGFREALRAALGRDPKNFEKPLDLSQAKLPPVKTDVQIQPAPVMLDGRVIGQLIQKAIVKAGSIIGSTSSFDATAMPRAAGQ